MPIPALALRLMKWLKFNISLPVSRVSQSAICVLTFGWDFVVGFLAWWMVIGSKN
jgi:hypothetical protein